MATAPKVAARTLNKGWWRRGPPVVAEWKSSYEVKSRGRSMVYPMTPVRAIWRVVGDEAAT